MKYKRGKGYCDETGIAIPKDTQKHNTERKANVCELNSKDGTIRHEMGHYLDRKNGWISLHDPAFQDAINSFKISPEQIKKVSPGGEYFYNSPMSDTFAALTSSRHHGWFDHGKRYWNKNAANTPTEIFANLTNAFSAKDKTYWKLMQKEFPALTKAYEDIITRLS